MTYFGGQDNFIFKIVPLDGFACKIFYHLLIENVLAEWSEMLRILAERVVWVVSNIRMVLNQKGGILSDNPPV